MRGDRRRRFWGRLGAGTMRGHRLEWRLRWGMEWGGGETVFFFFLVGSGDPTLVFLRFV